MTHALTTRFSFRRDAKAASPASFDRAIALIEHALSHVMTFAGGIASLAFLPLALIQGRTTRRRIPILPPPKGEYEGFVSGIGKPIRLLAIGESSVSGIGLSHSQETVAAVTARALRRYTDRPIVWRALGLSGGTVREAINQLLPRVRSDPTDQLLVAFGVNDATSFRSPKAYAGDLVSLVSAVRGRVGDAPAVIAGVAPLNSFPALPWPLNVILGWRSRALQAVIEGLPGRLTGLAVERFSVPFTADLFADDQFHPNSKAHKLWGEEIAALRYHWSIEFPMATNEPCLGRALELRKAAR
jgi:lysophospholipase L1-like esterase